MKTYKQPTAIALEAYASQLLAISFKEPDKDNIGVNTEEQHDITDALINHQSFWDAFEWDVKE